MWFAPWRAMVKSLLASNRSCLSSCADSPLVLLKDIDRCGFALVLHAVNTTGSSTSAAALMRPMAAVCV